MKISLIGLGNMGSRIARRLLDHGYQLSVYDMDVARAEAIAARGGVVAKSIPDLVRSVDVLLSCLTNDEAVRSVYTEPEGVFAAARSGLVILEMSTPGGLLDSTRDIVEKIMTSRVPVIVYVAPAGSRAAIVFIHIGTPPSMNLPDIISISLPILHRPARR